MRSASRVSDNNLKASLLFPPCLILAAVAGCNRSSTTNGNVATNQNGSTASAARCEDLAEGSALISDSAGVTADCDEVVVVTGDDDDLKTVAIQTDSGTFIGSFEDGEFVAGKDSDDNTIVARDLDEVSGSASTTVTRVTGIDGGGNDVSLIVTRSADETAARRKPSQNAPGFCAEVLEFADLIVTACDQTANELPGCSGPLLAAAHAGIELCQAQVFEQATDISGLRFQEEPQIPLGIEGYVTTRPAAGGTTFICSSVAFGGSPPFDVSWAWVGGETTTVTQLAGGTAVADTSAQAGEFEFEVTVTDGAGSTTTDTIKLTLDDDFTGLGVVVSDTSPAAGEEVCFSIGGTTISSRGVRRRSENWPAAVLLGLWRRQRRWGRNHLPHLR